MPNLDRFAERKSPVRQPENPELEAPTSLTDALARVRREALQRVTDQLNGKLSAPDERASLFGDIRRSVGKAVKERSEVAGFPFPLSASLS